MTTFVFVCFLFFFFSSRRRHTRCLSDWSSDVCSSDLLSAKTRPTVAEAARQIGAFAAAHFVWGTGFELLGELRDEAPGRPRTCYAGGADGPTHDLVGATSSPKR